MKLNLENNKGYVIVDDGTGDVLDVFVQDTGISLGFNNKITESYRCYGEKHFRL